MHMQAITESHSWSKCQNSLTMGCPDWCAYNTPLHLCLGNIMETSSYIIVKVRRPGHLLCDLSCVYDMKEAASTSSQQHGCLIKT